MIVFRQAGKLLLAVSMVLAMPAWGSDPGAIVAGHWLELRGNKDDDGVFVAQRAELVEPQDKSVLIGTVTSADEVGEFQLLGQPVQFSGKTVFRKLESQRLLDQRVKVEGHFRGRNRFSARSVSPRGPGRDRMVGLVRDIRKLADGYMLTVMNQQVFVAGTLELRHERPINSYPVASLNIVDLPGRQVSEDDQFGEGIRISDRLRFTTLIEARYKGEDNYDLYDRRDLDRQDIGGSARGRLILSPGKYGISGQLEARYTYVSVDEGLLGDFTVKDTRLGESFIFFEDPFGIDFDIQAGRIDFDDRREWLYDQNLDGVRVFWTLGGWLTELSASTTLSDGRLRDENTDNFIAYVSEPDRRFAAYIIHRDTRLNGSKERVTHMGIRSFVDWPPDHESWLEVARMSGDRNGTDLGGWGFDIGTTRELGERWYLTAAWAFGQGDARTGDGNDGNFRQTQLQDNNGKFGGVTSFRYYGELMDPELANMHIATLGVGFRFAERASLDLVGHYYRQDVAARRIIDSDIDQRPSGIHRELGWEIDAILGWRPVRAWDFELVVGWFRPGKAFRRRDDAWVTKLQARYRY